MGSAWLYLSPSDDGDSDQESSGGLVGYVKSQPVIASVVAAAVGGIGLYFATGTDDFESNDQVRRAKSTSVTVSGTNIESNRKNYWLWVVGLLVLCAPLLLCLRKKKQPEPAPVFDVEAPQPRPVRRGLNFPKKLMDNARRRS